MLGYAFWHYPFGHVAAEDYQQRAAAFHRALAQAAPPGFVRSAVFRVEGAVTWLAGTPAYADWYLVESFAALEPLNTAAVSGICQEPHTRVAQAMAAGAGSVFDLRTGAPDLASARSLTFLTKPRDLPYPDFYTRLEPHPATLWRRALVLGPTPEFALLSPDPSPVPALFQPLHLSLTPIWPST